MLNVRVALDWTPNTLHAGLIYAVQQGWYENAGMSVELISPEADNYHCTPAKKLTNGMVHIAVAPTETVISYQTQRKPVDIKAFAAILQHDLSSIAVHGTSGIQRPADLDCKIYGSFAARFEEAIVQQMIRNDGGHGFLRISQPDKLKIWDEFMTGKVHSMWLFEPWEGLLAKRKGISLRHFKMSQFGIPYGYSPLLLSMNSLMTEYPEEMRTFTQITAKAYEKVATDTEHAAEVLSKSKMHACLENTEFVHESLEQLKPALLNNEGKWGVMNDKKWADFTMWLDMQGLVSCLETGKKIQVSEFRSQLYTNEYFHQQ